MAPAGEGGVGRFEKEVAAFTASDQRAMPPVGGILFTGASGVRLWRSLANDFSGLPVFNRAIGGSYTRELTEYLGRIIIPYQPRIVVLQPGSNDLAAGKKPEEVLSDLRDFVTALRASLPKTRIVYLGINPSPARWSLRGPQQETNVLIAQYLKTVSDAFFIDFWAGTLGEDGTPRVDFFIADRLHPSPLAYEERAKLIRRVLE